MNELASIFKALSDETRLRIMKLLEQGELCVCDIVGALNLIQPKISFHLGVLKEAGLVLDRKDGKWIHYRFDESDAFRRFLILSVLERMPEEKVRADTIRLEKWLQKKMAKACCPVATKRKAEKQRS
jgi:ArsR family transcriptional regulator